MQGSKKCSISNKVDGNEVNVLGKTEDKDLDVEDMYENFE